MGIIKQITGQIESVEGVKLLDVDPGKGTNRTVVTFVGKPEVVIEAAYLAIRKAAELIDMRKHSGEHPRMGATDVCPLIPIAGVTMEECAEYARQLGKRVGDTLNIPVYLYENAQTNKERNNLSVIRAGEYEGFFKKIKEPLWKPDFGPAVFNESAGGTVIGARDFLIAYNVNLNTKSTRIANRIAFDVREAGRVKREGNPVSGKIVLDAKGEPERIPGKLKHVKAIGWFIEEYDRAQISMNLTNYRETPLHTAYLETVKSAEQRGVRVTGSELVGLIPLAPMLLAGKYFLKKQGVSRGVSEKEVLDCAISSMGLSDISHFDPAKKIIEYVLKDADDEKLVGMSVRDFANETGSDKPAPGGGSIAALSGAMGAALGTMVANLSANKRGWEDKVEEFSPWAEKGQKIKDHLLLLVDEDTRAFNAIMTAYGFPKDTDEQKKMRKEAIEKASKHATEVPLRTMIEAAEAIELLKNMADYGNPNSLSDSGVGVLCIKTAIQGCWLNVLTNANGLEDRAWAEEIVRRAEELMKRSVADCDAIFVGIEGHFRGQAVSNG